MKIIFKRQTPWVDEYLDNKEKYNLKNRTMKEIVDDDLFAKKLPKTWVNIDTVEDQSKIL